jgi:hypothetical protein
VVVSVLDPTQPSGASTAPLVDIDKIEPDASLMADLRRTRITTPFTRVLLVLIVLSVGFLGGALVDRWQRPSSSSSTLASALSQFRAGRGAAGGSGGSGAAGSGAAGGGAAAFFGGGAAGGATIGTVKLVDGTNVYVQDTAGDDIKVTTSPSTQVTVTKPGKLSDLAPGSTVIVLGQQSSDGTSVAATSITPSAGRGAGGFGGGRGGAAAAATGG